MEILEGVVPPEQKQEKERKFFPLPEFISLNGTPVQYTHSGHVLNEKGFPMRYPHGVPEMDSGENPKLDADGNLTLKLRNKETVSVLEMSSLEGESVIYATRWKKSPSHPDHFVETIEAAHAAKPYSRVLLGRVLGKDGQSLTQHEYADWIVDHYASPALKVSIGDESDKKMTWDQRLMNDWNATHEGFAYLDFINPNLYDTQRWDKVSTFIRQWTKEHAIEPQLPTFHHTIERHIVDALKDAYRIPPNDFLFTAPIKDLADDADTAVDGSQCQSFVQ